MISRSPFGDVIEYTINATEEQQRLSEFVHNTRKTVVIQGLGFVGTAMAAAVARARDTHGNPLYNVIGIDLPDEMNYWKIARVNTGLPPVVSTDKSLDAAYAAAYHAGNLTATYSSFAYTLADIIVVDIHLDIKKARLGDARAYEFTLENYQEALRVVAERITNNTLILIETTVPPGTTENILKPMIERIGRERGLDTSTIHIAHSYERVMPGRDYLRSITDFYRVYAGTDKAACIAAREFLSSFINTRDFPLTELHSPTASEMSKVLENSFRAMNIAFMQEWTEFAEAAGVNLFDVIRAIRVRPTHRNIMSPGFGVGGYCLTKDSLLADWSYSSLFAPGKHLDMSLSAINTNDLMPTHTVRLLQRVFPDLRDKHITLFGVSYLNDVADTRYSPAELFYDLCTQAGARVQLHDPLVSYWTEKGLEVCTQFDDIRLLHHDAAVFAVRHSEYLQMTAEDIHAILPNVRLIIDAFDIISDSTAEALRSYGITLLGVGKGHWNAYLRST
ncbi:MAG: nucleotide sugar dehydrogenase [Bacteroidota bacterium]|nr:nucleotide sugar dehydrogenase [Candidatus Kapabacteria bacterium]MDW8219767.1 nucleotide sugar dehydrogenase [Bacteroidota bacterium]